MTSRPSTLAAALCAATLLAGCGERSDPVTYRLIDRLEIDPSAAEAARQPVFGWDFETAADLAPWELTNIDGGAEPTDRGLAFFSTEADPYLWRWVGFDASAVETIRVRIAAAAGYPAGAEPGGEVAPSPGSPGKVQLFWNGIHQEFSETRQVALEQPTRSLDDGSLVYELPVASHPSWSGRIERLRVDPTNRYRMTITLARVEGLPRKIDGQASVGRVEIGSEQRRALRVAPGAPLEAEVEIPAGGVLRFGYGLLGELSPATDSPVELRVSVTPDETGVRERVFDAALPGRETGWRPARVDLGDYAGQRLGLRFESSAPAGSDAWPVIAHPEISTAGDHGRPNVLLISIDTLRADHLSLYGYPHETSPEIDAWAREHGVTFEHTVAPSSWTLPSHVSMFTGLDALTHGVNHMSTSMSPDLPTLTGLLYRAGYQTAAITGGGFVNPGYGLERGFDRFRWWPHDAGGPGEIGTHADIALEWLEELSDRPFFLFFHTYEVHSPFHQREPHFTAFGGRRRDRDKKPLLASSDSMDEAEGFKHRHKLHWDDPSTPTVEPAVLTALYDAGIAYTDAVVGRLLDQLERLDLLEDTIVVLTSDHGESLGEHGMVSHGNLYDDNLLVPLVISYPRRLPGARRVDRQVRLIDLVPTVLDLADLETPPGLDAVSLLPLMSGGDSDTETPPAWSYSAWPNFGLAVRRSNTVKYILNDALWPAVCAGEELYELERDGAELDDRAEVSELTGELRRQLEGYVRRRASGLILEIANPGDEPFDLYLSGSHFLPWTVKWLTGTCPQAKRLESSIRITAVPGQTTTLVWQRALQQRLTITARANGADDPERQESITVEDPRALTRGRTLHDDGQQWQWVEGRVREPWTGVRVWWIEPRGAAATTESPEVLEQLKALGYLK